MFIHGGRSSIAHSTNLHDSHIFDAARQSWTRVTDVGSPPALAGHNIVALGVEDEAKNQDVTLLLFGGVYSNGSNYALTNSIFVCQLLNTTTDDPTCFWNELKFSNDSNLAPSRKLLHA
jgi:hypothetical protein